MKGYISPVYGTKAIHVSQIRPSSYRQNDFAPLEMELLHESIKSDGYTLPIVCYYDKDEEIYIIVDGYYRYRVIVEYADIYEREKGFLPVVVISKPCAGRLASTIRHSWTQIGYGKKNIGQIFNRIHELNLSDRWLADQLCMDQNEFDRLRKMSGDH
ncbi:ParB N-terminal domain-containing protein [Ligilactobacillus murinus]|uniref:ParB N-terminal domain-containing protein n=1 Tax=Ligilactobacillus murinus TaxID=1622 RepID=UPI00096F1B4F|nr:ParB N-terminal domain-containing protein [Ligilactobacillus murinus]